MKLLVIFLTLFVLISLSVGKKNVKKIRIPAKINHYKNETMDVVFNKVAGELNNKIKIFCIFLTTPKNRIIRIRHQKNTWVKRCNAYIYASGAEDNTIPSIKAYKDDHYRFSYAKMTNGFRYVYKHYGDKYDWFLKIDCDTYVVMENLRMSLYNRNPEKHYYSGFQFNLPTSKDKTFKYHHGGSGYVMSKKTFATLVTKGLGNKDHCRIKDNGYEDLEIGICLHSLKIKAADGRDKDGKIAWLPIYLEKALTPYNNYEKHYYLHVRSVHKYENGLESLSQYPIAFHRVKGDSMYLLEYLLYRANVAGLRNPMLIPEHENAVEESESVLQQISHYSDHFYKH